MLSRIVSIWDGGTVWRMDFSTSSQRRAVSSMRVPVLARTCRMKEPLSDEGKKFWPRNGMSSRTSAQQASEGILRVRCVVVVRLEQVHRERRDEGSREEVGREHREDDGFSERNEEEARDAGEEEHRQEDDADAERGGECWNGDL